MESTVRSVAMDFFRSVGMTHIFGNPGSTELPMFRDFPADFNYVLGLQESVVVGMADGYAQATRRAALVNLHSAAGVGHALGNLFTAYRNQSPLVITAGQQARSILPYEPFLFAERASEFPRPYVKWAVEPARPEDVPAALQRAWLVAMEPPMGPTFVSIPADDWDRPCEPLAHRRVTATNPGDPAALADIAAALSQAERPAIVVGAGVARDGAFEPLARLAERHAALVFTAPMSQRNGFAEDHPLFAGFLPAGREAIVAALAGHDLALAIGGPLHTYHTEGFGPHLPEGTRMFQIVDRHATAAWAPAGTAVIADARAAILTLLEGPAPRPRTAPTGLARPAPLAPGALTDAYLLQQLSRLLPANGVIVEEAPSSRHPMHMRLPIRREDGFYTCASGGLGHGLPAAIGVALGRPEARVVALLGDGSAMYAIQGLWSAARLRLPMSFVIVNNRRYEALQNFGRHFGMQQLVGTRLDDIDFCALARGQGLTAERVDSTAMLDAALEQCLHSTGPSLLEVMVD